MRKASSKVREDAAGYYNRRGVLRDVEEESVEFTLEDDLRARILRGTRPRRLQNISIKLDPVQIHALRKLAVMKSTPYQALIRQWLAERLRQELHLAR